MLLHAVIKRNVVILAPATERVEEKNGVSVALSNELLTGVLEQENVTIMERVSDLESIDDISIFLDDGSLNLLWSQSVLIVAVVEDRSLDKAHRVSADQEVTLGKDSLSLGVVRRHAAEGTGADLFLAVVKENWVLDDSKDGIAADG